MLGSYRLCLALLVALSHVGIMVRGLNPGVVAVVGFYIVSGYVMTGLLRTHYSDIRNVARFYSDRLLRIYPHYLAIACVTLAWYVIHGVRTDYLRIQPGLVDIARNVLVIPLNFYMFNQSDQFTLVPPAWSLGAEMQFYVVMPFLLLAGPTVRRIALALSIVVFLLAAYGTIDSDWFGYRLLPGILFVFLLGSLLYDTHRQEKTPRRRRILVGTVVIGVVVLGVTLAAAGKLVLPYNREILLGLAVGIVTVNALAPLRRNVADDMLGNLSYGVFLNHFLVMWIVFGGKVAGPMQIVAYLAISILMSLALYSAIERPILSLRRKLRERPDAAFELLRHA